MAAVSGAVAAVAGDGVMSDAATAAAAAAAAQPVSDADLRVRPSLTVSHVLDEYFSGLTAPLDTAPAAAAEPAATATRAATALPTSPSHDETDDTLAVKLRQVRSGLRDALTRLDTVGEHVERDRVAAAQADRDALHAQPNLRTLPPQASVRAVARRTLGDAGLVDVRSMMDGVREHLRDTVAARPPARFSAAAEEAGYLQATKSMQSRALSMFNTVEQINRKVKFDVTEGADEEHVRLTTGTRPPSARAAATAAGAKGPAKPGAGAADAAGGASATQKTEPKPWSQRIKPEQREAERKVLRRMHAMRDFQSNPRYVGTSNAAGNAVSVVANPVRSLTASNLPLQPEPAELRFDDFEPGETYEAVVRVRNTSAVGRRMRLLPPTAPSIVIVSVEYPGGDGALAPGMSALVTVRFTPSTPTDVSDRLVITTDLGRVEVPIVAHRPPPELSLPDVLDVGDGMLYELVPRNFEVANTGGRASFRVCAEAAAHDDGHELIVGPFTLSPVMFDLERGQAIDLSVEFHPSTAGTHTETIEIECDTGQTLRYTLQGRAHHVVVDLVEFAGREVKGGDALSVSFEPSAPLGRQQKEFKVVNRSPVPVTYHWEVMTAAQFAWLQRVADGDSDAGAASDVATREPEPIFVVTPAYGRFKPNEAKTFTLRFEPRAAGTLYAYVFKFVLESVPDDRGQPSQREVFHFSAQGEGTPCKASISPPVLLFATPLLVGQVYRRDVYVRNDSDAPLDVGWAEREDDGCAGFSVKPAKATLQPGRTQTMQVIVRPRRIGRIDTTLFCDVSFSPPLAVMLQGEVQGPQIRVEQPVIDFGLVRPNTDATAVLNITNNSKIGTYVAVCESGAIPPAFPHVVPEGIISVPAVPQLVRPSVVVEPEMIFVAGGAMQPLEVCLQVPHVGPFASTLAVHVQNGATQYVSVRAHSQAPKVLLEPCTVELAGMFVGVSKVVTLTLRNMASIPALFQWDECKDEDFELLVDPAAGVIPPRGTVSVTACVVPEVVGAFEALIGCHIEGVAAPLVCALEGEVAGLAVSVGLTVDDATPDESSSPDAAAGAAAPGATPTTIVPLSGVCGTIRTRLCTVSIVNNSGIPTRYTMHAEQYPAMNEPVSPTSFSAAEADRKQATFQPTKLGVSRALPPKAPGAGAALDTAVVTLAANGGGGDRVLASRAGTSGLGATLSGGNATGLSTRRRRVLLSNEHEHTQRFRSNAGMERTLARVDEEGAVERLRTLLSTKRGCAVHISAPKGVVGPFQSVNVSVECVADVPGEYDDVLVCVVDGVDQPTRMPVRMVAGGSLLRVLESTVGFVPGSSPPRVAFPPQPFAAPAAQRAVQIENSGPFELDVALRAVKMGVDEQVISVSLDVGDTDRDDAVRLRISPYEYEAASSVSVQPARVRIPPRRTQRLQVALQGAHVEHVLEGVLCQATIVDRQAPQHLRGRALDPLRVLVEGSFFTPRLEPNVVNKLRFVSTTVVPDARTAKQRVVFKNPCGTTVYVRAFTDDEAVFVVRGVDVGGPLPSVPQAATPPFVAVGAQQTLTVTLAFVPTKAQLATASASLHDERVLGALLLLFDSGHEQRLALEATIAAPRLSATPAALDFGAPLRVSNTRVLEVTLANGSDAADAHWSVLSAPPGIRLEPDSGTLPAADEHLPQKQRVRVVFCPTQPAALSAGAAVQLQVRGGITQVVRLTGRAVLDEDAANPYQTHA